jgi:hypothetical protein
VLKASKEIQTSCVELSVAEAIPNAKLTRLASTPTVWIRAWLTILAEETLNAMCETTKLNVDALAVTVAIHETFAELLAVKVTTIVHLIKCAAMNNVSIHVSTTTCVHHVPNVWLKTTWLFANVLQDSLEILTSTANLSSNMSANMTPNVHRLSLVSTTSAKILVLS